MMEVWVKMKLESDAALLGKRDIITRLYARLGYPAFTSELRSVQWPQLAATTLIQVCPIGYFNVKFINTIRTLFLGCTVN